jgi:hypothetical protein
LELLLAAQAGLFAVDTLALKAVLDSLESQLRTSASFKPLKRLSIRKVNRTGFAGGSNF